MKILAALLFFVSLASAQTLVNPPAPPAPGVHRFCDVYQDATTPLTTTCWDMDPLMTVAGNAYVACGPMACFGSGGPGVGNAPFSSFQAMILYDILNKVIPGWLNAYAAQQTASVRAAVAAAQGAAKQ